MKAVLSTRYGSADVLALSDIPKPAPKETEVLIRVRASVVTPSDIAFRKGDPIIVRFIYGLRKPRLSTQGVEFAGEIEAVGDKVTQFKAGDAVFGMSTHTFGAHAEYLCLPETEVIGLKPVNVNEAEAVGVVDGATTALTFLRDVAKLQAGQRILINGASGAVGAYAVQLAKYFGAHVTAVCGSSNVQWVKALGADQVIDYTQTDFTKTGETYDVIFDAVGKRTFSACKAALTPTGVYLATTPTLAIVFQMLWTSLFGSKKAKFATAGLMQNHDNLNFLKTLVETGKLKAVIDRSYPLTDMAQAHRYVEAGHKKGNVVITV